MNEIERIDERLEVLHTLKNALGEIVVFLYERRRKLVSASIEIPDPITPEWFMSFSQWREIGGDVYGRLADWFDKTYADKGLGRDGSWPGGQVVLELRLDQNKPFEDQLGLLDFWPHVRPGTTDDGDVYCYVDIMEYTLSQNNHYFMRANPEKTEIIVTSRYRQVLCKTGDIREAVRYVYDRLPYLKRSRQTPG